MLVSFGAASAALDRRGVVSTLSICHGAQKRRTWSGSALGDRASRNPALPPACVMQPTSLHMALAVVGEHRERAAFGLALLGV